MTAFPLRVVLAPDSRPGHPVVEVMILRSARRGKGGQPLDVEHWHLAGGRVGEAIAWLRQHTVWGVEPAQVSHAKVRIAVRHLDLLPDWVHAALGLPHAASATILLRLRDDVRASFDWEIEATDVEAPSPVAGLYEEKGRLRYLPPGLQEGLDGISARGPQGALPTVDEMRDRWSGFLPAQSWEHLRRGGTLRLRLASRCVLMAHHDRDIGFRFAMGPVDPSDGRSLVLHDPYGRFMAALDDTLGAEIPAALTFEGEPVFMTDAFRAQALVIRNFNRKDFLERSAWGMRLEQLFKPDGTPRVIAGAETFGDRIVAYGPIEAAEYADLVAAMKAPRETAEDRRHRRGAPSDDRIDPALRAEFVAVFGEPDDALPIETDDGNVEVPVGIDSLSASSPGPLPVGAGPYPSVMDIGGDADPSPSAQGDQPLADPGSPDRFRTGFMLSHVNLGEEEATAGPRAFPVDIGDWDERNLCSLLAKEADGKRLPKVRPHQVEVAKWTWDLWRNGCRGALLCDEPGTGKTLALLLAALCLRDRMGDRPILFVVEDHMKEVWCAELRKWIRGRADFMRAFGSDFRRTFPLHKLHEMERRTLVLTTWDVLSAESHTFQQLKCGILIADEASVAKNPLSRRRIALQGMQAQLRLLATGTPIENGLADLWSLMEAASPGSLGGWVSFRNRFMAEGASPERLAVLHEMLLGGDLPMMLRRTKEGLGLGLPLKVVRRVELEMKGNQAEEYRREHERSRLSGKLRHRLRVLSLHHNFKEMRGRTSVPAWDATRWLRQSAVLCFTLEELERAKAAGLKVILFTTDIVLGQEPVALALGAALGLGRPVATVSGKASQAERDAAIKAFRESEGFDVLMLSNRLCARGLTLTEASTVIMLSRWYNPAVEAQAMDRVHRLGLAHDVTVLIPLARHPRIGAHSYDIVLDDMLADKSAQSSGFLDPVVLREEEFEEELARAA